VTDWNEKAVPEEYAEEIRARIAELKKAGTP
jgi:hypothetical protein